MNFNSCWMLRGSLREWCVIYFLVNYNRNKRLSSLKSSWQYVFSAIQIYRQYFRWSQKYWNLDSVKIPLDIQFHFLFSRFFVIVQCFPIMIGITTIFIFHNFSWSLEKSRYLSSFRFPLPLLSDLWKLLSVLINKIILCFSLQLSQVFKPDVTDSMNLECNSILTFTLIILIL